MALFMSHMTNEFVKTLSSSVQKEAEELGYTGDSFKIYDGKNDVATQVSQIEQAVALGVDGIIIEPVSTDGIVKAVKEAGLTDKIKIYGVDATSDGLNAIANGGMTGTVSQGTEDQGKISADLCSNLIYGQSVPKEVIATNVVYTKENVNEILKK